MVCVMVCVSVHKTCVMVCVCAGDSTGGMVAEMNSLTGAAMAQPDFTQNSSLIPGERHTKDHTHNNTQHRQTQTDHTGRHRPDTQTHRPE